jgi:hypothetical protein
MTHLGRHQRTIMSCFERKSRLPVGYLIRETQSDPKTVDASLRCLKRRGVVRRVSYGVWELVA